jgi:outer membrane protein TolC
MALKTVTRGAQAVVTAIVVVAGTPTLGAQSPGALTLEAAIAEALQHSPELQPGEDAVKLATVRTRLAASAFGVKVAPTLSANSDPILGGTREAGVSVTKRLDTGAQTFATVSSYQFGTSSAALRDASYSVGISQPLLRGFTRTAMADVTNATRAAVGADRDLSIARAALVVHVTAQYFAVVKQQRLSEAARQAADRATALRVASEARTRVGLATELDVLRAEVLESQMGASVASATGALSAAQDELAVLIGRPLGEPIAVANGTDGREDPRGVESISSSVEELTRTALATRVEVREAHDRVGDAARAVEVAHWNLLPPIALDVSYTRRSITSSIGIAPSLATSGWKVGVSTAYALDRSAEVAAAETARISVEAARRAAEQTEQRVAGEVRQSYRAWQTAGTTVTIQQRGLELAQRELRLAELRFERGLASSLDVIDAQNSVLQAQNALIAAELDRTVFALDLRRATGVLDMGRVFQ